MCVAFHVERRNRSAQQRPLPIARIDKLQAKMAAPNDKASARDLIQEDGNDGLAGEAHGRSDPGAHQLIRSLAGRQGLREVNLS
jgi:hypothetical protein